MPDNPCIAVLQARATSRRLPGKVLADICGEPMLARQIERVRRSAEINRIVLATSTDASDDPVADLGTSLGVGVYRGSLYDVLDRFCLAARSSGAANVVRLTGDCPLNDPDVIDRVIAEFMTRNVDYASNALLPTYPDGLDVEVMSMSTLEHAWQAARLPSEREHVTPYIYKHPELFRVHSVEQSANLSHMRWTVDTPADLHFIRRVYAELLPISSAFTTTDILDLINRDPGIAALNASSRRNEGYETSLRRDGNDVKG